MFQKPFSFHANSLITQYSILQIHIFFQLQSSHSADISHNPEPTDDSLYGLVIFLVIFVFLASLTSGLLVCLTKIWCGSRPSGDGRREGGQQANPKTSSAAPSAGSPVTPNQQPVTNQYFTYSIICLIFVCCEL